MSKLHTLSKILRILIKNPSALKRVLDAESGPERSAHDEVYDAGYFQFVEQTSAQSAGTIARSIVRSLNPSSLIDVGCGTGILLECLRDQGVQVSGLEYAEAALKLCRSRQLDVIKFNVVTDELPSEAGEADVAVSMEVGQQIPKSSADRYIDLLCRLAHIVVFSSATPGQGDRKPCNEQPHQYWIDMFRRREYLFDESLSRQWREEWKTQGTAPWFYRNVMIFRKRMID